jgi:NAD(P)-dependent dehydrogenase (short-subunit alcohol dehydrogenase family)
VRALVTGANGSLYLASPEAGYVTGQEIVVAGGGDLLQVSLGRG